jgi:ABC-type polysaccharide/polyol phosphate transport system ATPase subunit
VAAAIRFESVTKSYGVSEARYASLRQDLATAMSRATRGSGRGRLDLNGPPALRDVSVAVDEGEALAIIGPNGAGKTTALKLIARIVRPTSGIVRVRGRVGALIEVGAGVHPELTGRENVWLYGQILGMTKADIRRRFDEIVDFGEVGAVLDRRVATYSTGMQLRLGFAIAVHLAPDIFVVDETLAVGDAGFQAKCVERMTKLIREGHTLILVSHDLSPVEAICRRAIFLHEGQVRAEGPAKAVVSTYLDWINTAQWTRNASRPVPGDGSPQLTLERVSCHDAGGAERYGYETGEDVEVRLSFRAATPIPRPHVTLGISVGGSDSLIQCSMLADGEAPERLEDGSVVSCRLHALPLLPRAYQLWCSVQTQHAYGDVLDWQPVGSFRISRGPKASGPAAHTSLSYGGPVHVAHTWNVHR